MSICFLFPHCEIHQNAKAVKTNHSANSQHCATTYEKDSGSSSYNPPSSPNHWCTRSGISETVAALPEEPLEEANVLLNLLYFLFAHPKDPFVSLAKLLVTSKYCYPGGSTTKTKLPIRQDSIASDVFNHTHHILPQLP